ncbi:antitoxin (DNA-binding transcriptional repressor) of toxin-antitoxin stability system [Rhodovulum iodosum]|uniref:Antitoxin (DNA-binding transcriptional repressor) of toxin-antitoxin stability system n=1 Tax=Rhodovulum iodosum TaxID=68291 RepID=A0ABV3XYF2_9RHOB|nr:SPOR domain-containing protein [Rhodovulum robiginosum]RSK33445.1 SPOR domain-containing protein [Rhodovulum robiginosum]
MAESTYDAFDAGTAQTAPGRSAARIVAWAGGLTSAALVAGLAVWGYQLVVRDVSGVPVVRALEGPVRIAPEDPGGERAAYQGLAVNRVAAEGQAAPAPDRVALAPRPVSLTDEDRPAADLSPARRPALSALPETGDAAGQTPEPAAQADAAGADAAAEEEGATLPAGAIARTVPGVAHSPRPPARPEGDLAARMAIAAATAAVSPGIPDELPAGEIIAGTVLVQLGAFDTPDEARSDWTRLSGRFDSFMTGKSRVVQGAESGGRSFYRLRAAGFADLADARRFCAALMAEGADCIPVVAR